MNEPIRLNPECIRCLLQSRLEQYPEDCSREKKIEYMQRVLKTLSELELHQSAPLAAREIEKIQTELFGYTFDYSETKRYFNDFILKKVPLLTERLAESNDALKLAIQYAMTGNYIDFGAVKNVNEEQLEQLIHDAEQIQVNENVYQQLKSDILSADKLVFLTDNCGEIVFDKLLISAVKKQYPHIHVTAIVRGEETGNDATIVDAEQICLFEVADVVGNGSDVLGTCMELISDEARTLIDEADVVLAKGQGNFETLYGCGKNIYYIFLCKCEMFAKRFQVPKFTGMLLHEKDVVA